MEHKIFYDEKEEVVRVIVSGEFTRDHAGESINTIRNIFQNKQKRDIFCDVSASTNVFESKETRRWFRSKVSQIHWDRIAVTGAGPVNKMFAKITLKFFRDDDEALSWLNDGEQ